MFSVTEYISDRQRVELLIPPQLVRVLCKNILDDSGTDDDDAAAIREVIADLDHTIMEIAGPEPWRTEKLIKRAHRVVNAALPPRAEHLGSVILAIHWLIEGLIREGWIVLHEGSAFDRAWTRLIEGLLSAPDAGCLDGPERRTEATRIAADIRRRLADQGFFKEVVT